MSATPRPSLYQDLDYLGSASAYADEVFEAISKEALFEGFSHHEIEALCQYMHCFAAPAGATLLHEGDGGAFLLVVLSGKVGVNKLDEAGQSLGLAVVGPGSILGEMSLIDGEPRFASCITAEPTDFAVMSRLDLNEVLVIHPRLANKFLIKMLQIMVGRMRDTGMRLVSNRHFAGPIV
jgi:CRP/FNR family transcriptional regulator, cyclic AMP receptor protein